MTKNSSWKIIPGILRNEAMGVGLWGVLMGFPEEHTVFPLCLWGIRSDLGDRRMVTSWTQTCSIAQPLRLAFPWHPVGISRRRPLGPQFPFSHLLWDEPGLNGLQRDNDLSDGVRKLTQGLLSNVQDSTIQEKYNVSHQCETSYIVQNFLVAT